MKENDFVIFLLICFTSFCAFKLIEGIIIDFTWKRLRLKSSYTKLVKGVLYYSAPFLKQNNIKYYPLYQVSYVKNKKRRLGCYFLEKKKIVIYIKNHNCGSETSNLREIVHTILHEIKHYCDHQLNPDFKNYEVYTKRYTYFLNPFEKKANQHADAHLEDCIKFLKQKGIIS
jgi:hypothetical protein